MAEPDWAKVSYPPIDYQAICYYFRAQADRDRPEEPLAEVDPELLRTYEKLGIPLQEQEVLAGVAVDCGVRQRLGGDHLQGQAGGARRHLLLDLRGGREPSGAGAAVPGLAWCPTATTSSPR